MNSRGDEHPGPGAGTRVLGRYEILEVIGRGGMGVVSRARDVQTGRLVAVKHVRAEGERGEREAMAAARLRHPAIVELLQAEASSGSWIIVSELVEGADLRAVLRTGDVPELDIARFAGSIVRGLAHAHQHGVVHRDVKPANILCPADPRRAGAWAKLTDFGVAALAGAETLTAVGDVVGTMAYMAPEQARGDRAGAPADVFALAVVVYESLAGVNPRRGSTAAETAARALTSMPPLARLRPDLPSGVHAAIDHCLELEPGHRGGLLDLDEGLRKLAAIAARGGSARRDATGVTRLDDRPRHEPVAAHPPMAANDTDHGARRPAGATAFDPRGGQNPLVPSLGPPVAPRGELPKVPLRLLGTAGAAAALFVMSDRASAPLPLIAIAAVALILPRVTWVGVAVAAVTLLSSRDHVAATLALVAGLAPLALLPGRGALWPAGGLAAGLAAISAPAAWPALAALAPRTWIRAALAVQGAVVTSVVATATSVPLLDVPAGNLVAVATQFVLPLAGVWVVAAVLLSVMVSGRTFAADLVAAVAWTAAVGGAMVAAKLAGPDPLLWAGPAVAAAIVVVARAATRERAALPCGGWRSCATSSNR